MTVLDYVYVRTVLLKLYCACAVSVINGQKLYENLLTCSLTTETEGSKNLSEDLPS